jgi:antitoxin MazE
MQISIVRIGNSRGIRLPRAIIEQCGFQDSVQLEVHDGALIVRPVSDPRAGWEAALAELAQRGGDEILDPDTVSNPTEWESEEWEW